MTRQTRVTEVLVELADTLVVDFDVIDFLHTLVERSVELLAVDAAGLLLADQQGRLEVLAASSESARLLELFELQSAGGPCMECFTTGAQRVNLGIADLAVQWPSFADAVATAGYRSVHALPLRLRGQVLGAMNLFGRSESSLTGDDIALGQGMADIATIGLLQQRRSREQDLLTEQLQAALNTRIVLEQAKGVLAERAQIPLPEAFGRIRAHAHRVRQPLTTIAYGIVEGRIVLDELTAP